MSKSNYGEFSIIKVNREIKMKFYIDSGMKNCEFIHYYAKMFKAFEFWDL